MKNLYLIALTPPLEVEREIELIRKDCSVKHNCYAALKPPVHLTIKENFELMPHDELKLIRTLKSAAMHNQSFTQRLNNFDKFYNHTIYIKGNKPVELANLKKQIIKNIKTHFRYVENEHLPFKPHVTIAYRDIPTENFDTIFGDYKEANFKAEYLCNQFVLFKHNSKKWEVLETFELTGMPQITLFD